MRLGTKHLIILLALVSHLFLLAAGKRPDPVEQVRNLRESARHCLPGDPDKALALGEQSLTLALELGDQAEIAHARDILITIHMKKKNFPKALEQLKERCAWAEKTGDSDSLMHSYFKTGYASLEMGNYPQALEYYLKSLRISEKKGDRKTTGTIYNNIGIIHDRQNDLPIALKYYFAGLEIDKELNNPRLMAAAYNNIAVIYDKQGKHRLSETYYLKSLELAKKMEHHAGIARIYCNLGELFFNQQDYPKARSYYNQVARLDIQPELAKTFIAERLLGLGRCDFAQGDYQQAVDNFSLALRTAREISSVEIQKKVSDYLSEVYKTMGRYKLAYRMKLVYEESQEKLLNAAKVKRLTQLEQQYEFEKKQQLLELEQKKKELEKEAEIRRQKFWFTIFLIAFLCATASIIILTKMFMIKRSANRQLNELNSTKDKFFSIIAHDLKKPFSTLIGFLKILLTEFDSYEKQKIKELLKTVQKTSEITYELLENLLLWANIQTGRIELKPESLDLHQIADSVLALFRLYANSKQIALRNEIPPDTLIVADQKMTRLILRNLVSNAIKFTPSGGEVLLQTNRHEGNIEVSVRDNGVGIDPEKTGKLFKIDQTFSTPGTAGEKGTGLGLALCKEFLDKSGGTIRVESRPGHGSVFTVSLGTQ